MKTINIIFLDIYLLSPTLWHQASIETLGIDITFPISKLFHKLILTPDKCGLHYQKPN